LFDPVRREIAKVSLERLLKDGEYVFLLKIIGKTSHEIEQKYKGNNLCHKVGVYDLPKDIVQMLGRFKYRFSYGQND
jgi:ribonuclease Y